MTLPQVKCVFQKEIKIWWKQVLFQSHWRCFGKRRGWWRRTVGCTLIQSAQLNWPTLETTTTTREREFTRESLEINFLDYYLLITVLYITWLLGTCCCCRSTVGPTSWRHTLACLQCFLNDSCSSPIWYVDRIAYCIGNSRHVSTWFICNISIRHTQHTWLLLALKLMVYYKKYIVFFPASFPF